MAEHLHPAMALLELGSIAEGIRVGDAMVKRAPVSVLYAGTVHPGKYLVMVGGDVASVEEAVAAATDDDPSTLIDRLFLADVDARVVRSLRGDTATDPAEDHPNEALGIFETSTVCAALLAAERGLKSADINLDGLHLADDLGGKAYCLFAGTVAEVEAGLDAAADAVGEDRTCARVLIPQIADEMRASLARVPRFADLLRADSARGKA